MARNDVTGGLTAIQAIEFTLDDTYDHLKDIYRELHEKTERLMVRDCDLNNHIYTLHPHSTTLDNMQDKELMLLQRFSNYHGYDLWTDPISNTIDVYKMDVWELEQEIFDILKVLDEIKEEALIMKNNLILIESGNNSLMRMRETCVDTSCRNTTDSIIHDEEVVNAKKLFSAVKKDLESTVEFIFPNHTGFKELLVELTAAYIKGSGDEVYADVGTMHIDCVKFMIEADIAIYHRNVKNKMRLVDLL